MKTLLLFCSFLTLGQWSFAQNQALMQREITAKDAQKLSKKNQKSLDILTDQTCDCITEHLIELNNFYDTFIAYNKKKRKGTETQADKDELRQAVIDSKNLSSCLKARELKASKKEDLRDEIRNEFNLEDISDVNLFMGKMITYKIGDRDDIPTMIQKRFDLYFLFLYSLNEKLQE